MLSNASHSNNPSPVRQETPVQSALGQLAGAAGSLEDRLEVLAAKLGPVLNPPCPTKADTADRAGSPIPIVGQIMQQTDRLLRLADQCSEIIDRVGV